MKSTVLGQLQTELHYLAVAAMLVLGARCVGIIGWEALAGQRHHELVRHEQHDTGRLPERLDTRLDIKRVQRAIEYLAEEIGPRPAGSSGEKQAARYIHGSLESLGYETITSEPIVLPGGRGYTQNVIASRPERHRGKWTLVVAAHYDSKNENCPAANDNGSGVGMLLEIARILSQRELPYRLLFLFCGAEEHLGDVSSPSLMGSRAFVNNYRVSGGEDIVGMINVDMVGVGEKLYMQTVGPHGDKLGEVVANSAHRLALRINHYHGPHGSDHIPFGWAGIPAVWLQRLPDPRRDTPEDQMQYVQAEALGEVGQLLVDVLDSVSGEKLEQLRG